MSMHRAGIVADGFARLRRSPWYWQKRAAIKREVLARHADELASARDYWQRLTVENRILREIKKRLEALGSPYCLWLSR
jgi:hypothetical protein